MINRNKKTRKNNVQKQENSFGKAHPPWQVVSIGALGAFIEGGCDHGDLSGMFRTGENHVSIYARVRWL